MPTRASFHQALEELWNGMADRALRDAMAIERATLALLDADRKLAESVISIEPEIDTWQLDIERQVIDLIALQQPVASDLRLVISAIPMSASLARMGGLARHVAQTARLRAPESAVAAELRGVFELIGQSAVMTATELHVALLERDVARAISIERGDARMDALHRQLFAILLDSGWPHGAEAAIDATLLGRFYERFADQAVNVARRLHFIVDNRYPPTVTGPAG
jgi:phosphate transport system protein